MREQVLTILYQIKSDISEFIKTCLKAIIVK